MSAFFNEENDIAEEDESSMDTCKQNRSARDSDKYQRPDLSEVDEARLRSCLDEIRNVVGDSIPEHFLIDIVLKNGFKFNEALDAVLNSVVYTTEKPAAGEFCTYFYIHYIVEKGSRSYKSRDLQKCQKTVNTIPNSLTLT
jgi:hypothetical protein